MTLSWMVQPVHLLQVADFNLRVDLGRLKRRMPEQLLDVANVGSTLQHVRGARMAKQVRMELLLDPGALRRALDGVDHGESVERPAVFREEDVMHSIVRRKPRARLLQVV